ncbi:hypothetical protein FRC11_013186, partial [Ceratobasidium sp. 423]
LITEVCFCENFLRKRWIPKFTLPPTNPLLLPELPYVLEYDGNEARWAPTGYPEVSTGKSRRIVHFAATSPGELSIAFNKGAVFTQAFYNINPSETRSLKEVAKKLQENVNTILSSDTRRRSQHPKVYSSRIMDEPHFFATLGFCSPNSAVETDSDSSG